MRRSAALAAAAALVGLLPASPAAAATPTHVAIVIVGHGVRCVPWHSGITGDEVLNDVATVKYRPTDGLITQIDGTPTNNRADATHYWSYWHNTGSGWRYSTSGAGSYLPKAGTVEGWHFINGSSTATPPPAHSYASICHDTAVPAPVVPPAATSTSAPATSARATTTTASVATSSVPARGRTSTTASSSTAPSATRTSLAGTPTAAPVVAAPADAADTVVSTLQARNTAAAAHHADEGSALPTVLVVAIVLVLGGAAAFVAQRRRRSP